MDDGIINRVSYERIVAMTIELNSCRKACTKDTFSIIYIKEDSILSIISGTPGIYFKMFKEKTWFSILKI